jgi:DNA-directed RNA polymerase specialized sigma24 family protein
MDKECAFETTQWTAVMAAADQKATGSIEALQKLCGVYWFPIYAYARSQGAGEGEAEDLTQSFFAHLLDKGLSIRSGRDGGRFRSFLIRCYRNFVTSEWRKENAVRRGGGTELLSFDELDTEVCSITEAEHALTPEELYERKWAQTLLARAVERLREEYVLVGKEDRFQQMSSGLTSDLDLGAYEAIGAYSWGSGTGVAVILNRSDNASKFPQLSPSSFENRILSLAIVHPSVDVSKSDAVPESRKTPAPPGAV